MIERVNGFYIMTDWG